MIGLIILLVAGVYLAAWVALVVFSYRKTLRQSRSKKKAFAVSGFFFLVMYLIPFWDLIPTLVAHKYYCNTQAGFWVYKSPEKWILENRNNLDTLDFNYISNKYGFNANHNNNQSIAENGLLLRARYDSSGSLRRIYVKKDSNECSGQQKPDKKLSTLFKFNRAFVAQS